MSNHPYLPELPDGTWEQGTIYYIMCAETGRMKIGYTTGHPRKRLKALQTGSPTKLAIAAIHPGTPESERRLHQQFAADHKHGEWFEISAELLIHCLDIYEMIIALAKSAGKEPPVWAVGGSEGVRKAMQQLIAEAEAEEGRATLQ